MKKNYCDCCGDEIEERVFGISVLCHLVEGSYYAININGNLESISGREVNYDLCLPCYNKVFGAAVDRMKEIKAKSIAGRLDKR